MDIDEVNALARAWQHAATDLGFEFVSPFTFFDEAGRSHTCSGLVPHFGGPKGTLIVSQHDPDPDADEVGASLGYYTSALSPHYYYSYVRETFMQTLADWGWYGPVSLRPSWLQRVDTGA